MKPPPPEFPRAFPQDDEPAPNLPPGFIRERPWIWIWVVFIILIAVWSYFITMTLTYQPQVVPLAPQAHHE